MASSGRKKMVDRRATNERRRRRGALSHPVLKIAQYPDLRIWRSEATPRSRRLASLIRAEATHRQSRSINYRISGARFLMPKDLDAFVLLIGPELRPVRTVGSQAF